MKTNDKIDVYVSQGLLRGIVKENIFGEHYIAYQGIPYAKPPVGELRFKDPEPPIPWDGVRDASKFGNVALQVNMLTREIIGDEDCLYLNVYTTTDTCTHYVHTIKPKRAVMVWIHGGSFIHGSGNDDIYGADYIVRKDVVLVTFNYRLDVFGFLNLHDEVATGNQALKDAIMALRWVRENISNFGGDPENITIFGESAGGCFVHHLTLCPLADGLFHKAISQSGVAAAPWAVIDWQKGFLLAEKLGKQTSDPKIAGEFLKTIDGKKLIETSQKLMTPKENRQLMIAFSPSLDSKSANPFFTADQATTIRRGVKVPFLLGFTSNEGSFFTRNLSIKAFELINSDFEAAIHPNILSSLEELSLTVEDLRSFYFDNKPVSKENLASYADLISDMLFHRSIYETADIQIQLNHPSTYLYKFSYESKIAFLRSLFNINIPGVTHAEELCYLFYPHIMKDLGLPHAEPDSMDYKISDRLTQMWTDFAKTGNPTPVITDNIPVTWTPLEKKDVYNYLNIDVGLRMESIRKEELRNWKNIKHKL